MSLGSVEGAGGGLARGGGISGGSKWQRQHEPLEGTSVPSGGGVRAGTYVEEQMAPSALPPLPGPGLHGPQHGRSMALALWVL